MTEWTTRLIGPTTGHPNRAAIRRDEHGRLELQLSGPMGYVRLGETGFEELAQFMAEQAAERECSLRGDEG